MKRILILAAFTAVLFGFGAGTQAKNMNEFGGGVYFYSSLSPYGNWIMLSTGVTVWRPGGIPTSWAPYTYGYWEWTDDGWYWESNEPFGYITCHYGRWFYDDYYGWVWVPDNRWAPAWVEWRYDNDYIGWAPLPPYAEFSIHIGINFTVRYSTPYTRWRFLSYRHMCDRYAYNYYIPEREVYRFYDRTKYRTNYGYSDGRVINRGVNIDYVRTRGGRDIRERRIERVTDPGLARDNGRNSGRVRTYFPGRDNIPRENVDERRIERSGRTTALNPGNLGVGRDNGNERGTVRRPILIGRPGQSGNDGRTVERREDRRMDRYNGTNRSNVERNRTITRPRNETPRVRTQQERTRVKTERNNSRNNERKQNDNGRKRRR